MTALNHLDMDAINKAEAVLSFESADSAVDAIVTAQFGFNDLSNRQCAAMYSRIFDNVLDERLKGFMLPDLIDFLHSEGESPFDWTIH